MAKNLNNSQFSQDAISHKELNDLFIKAKKDISSNVSYENNNKNDFNDLIKDWTKTSQQILVLMNQRDKNFTDNKDPKSLMAYGAMGAHISMALQALKATRSD